MSHYLGDWFFFQFAECTDLILLYHIWDMTANRQSLKDDVTLHTKGVMFFNSTRWDYQYKQMYIIYSIWAGFILVKILTGTKCPTKDCMNGTFQLCPTQDDINVRIWCIWLSLNREKIKQFKILFHVQIHSI